MWNKEISHTALITYISVLLALNVVANIFSVKLFGTNNYLTFTYVICFVTAVYFGFVPAISVSLLGDILGWLIAPSGAFNPFVSISSLLLGAIPALILLIPRLNRYAKVAISLLLCAVICTAGLNTYGLWWMYSAASGKSFWVYLAARVPFQLLILAINAILIYIIVGSKVLDKLLLNSPSKIQQADKTA